MFLKNPPILILDEATSALDAETEPFSAGLPACRLGTRTRYRSSAGDHPGSGPDCRRRRQGHRRAGTHHELIARHGAYDRLHDAQMKNH
ncbi:hypothetical protein ATY79_01435 [Rhizobium sp. R693]|nr:hypothetical protein ATY79_01435 [Rhizobium sp. R693]